MFPLSGCRYDIDVYTIWLLSLSMQQNGTDCPQEGISLTVEGHSGELDWVQLSQKIAR